MHRSFYGDPRYRQTFLFTFAYYTIISEDCNPMGWQLTDKESRSDESPMRLSRCSAVVALANRAGSRSDIVERAQGTVGCLISGRYGMYVSLCLLYLDLSNKCFPDWRATLDTFESSHQYLNGPEAFLHRLLSEFVDAKKRYSEICTVMAQMVQPLPNFVFEDILRDQRLFDDENYTWTRRYFYVHRMVSSPGRQAQCSYYLSHSD